MQGSGESNASDVCSALGGTVGLHADGPFSNGQTGPTESDSNGITYTIGQEWSDPYFPGGSSLFQGSVPIQDVNFTYPSSLNVLAVVVKGGTDYNVYTGSSNLTGNYISPLVAGKNVANISGFWVCLGAPSLLTPVVQTTPFPNGTSAYDTVSVSGNGPTTPAGSVTFTLYGPNGTVGTSTKPLVNGAAQSGTFTGLTPGNYYFVASYLSSDGVYSNLTGGQEQFSIGLLTPVVQTTPFPSGTNAYDTVSVTGSGPTTPAGSVTFTLYGPNGTVGTSTKPLVNGAAQSGTFTGLTPGNYYFVASYLSTDGVYSNLTGGQEQFSIGLLTPVVQTTPSVNGRSAIDSATVSGSGASVPSGTVTFQLFKSNGSEVAGYPAVTVGLGGNGSAVSAPTGSLAPGNYYFMVTYSGDGVYSAVLQGSPEPFTVFVVSPPKVPKKPSKPVVPPYRIPTKPPTTGLGGSAHPVYDGGLLASGGAILLLGLLTLAYALTRRRRL